VDANERNLARRVEPRDVGAYQWHTKPSRGIHFYSAGG
jgi:hypothetical protein